MMRFRRPGLGPLSSHVRFSGWLAHLARRRRLAAAVTAVGVLVLALLGVAAASVFASPGAPSAAAARQSAPPPGPAHHAPSAVVAGSRPAERGQVRHAAPARPEAQVRARPLRTSCRSVAHIGDSTSVGLISPEYLPDPAWRLAARYAHVGVRYLRVDASGGRSIVEVLPGQVNGYHVAAGWRSEGYRGCWVFALGTNDTANVSVGSAVGRMARIERMMSVAHGEPVLWVNARTLLASGPWSESNMQIWNDALQRACAIYPNLRIFDWSSVANPGWYISDGIHYTSAGYAARAYAIADALARAFRSGGASRGCLVR
jgi:lysophospholipase L1-like esterase